MKFFPALLGVIGAVLFVSAWVVPTDPAGRLSLLVAGGMIILLSYVLALENLAKSEVQRLEGMISSLMRDNAQLEREVDKMRLTVSDLKTTVSKVQTATYQNYWRWVAMEENLSSTDKG